MSAEERGPQPPTPELDRRAAVLPKAEVLTEFVDWLEAQGIALCTLEESGRYNVSGPVKEWFPRREPYEQMFERFFGLDGNKIEAERRALLEWLSKAPRS